MSRIELLFLGPPRIERDGGPVSLDTRKAVALLAYLAVTGEGQSRDTLATLLWPDADRSRGRSALRRTLSTVNKAFGGEGLAADRGTVGLDLHADLDIDVFRVRHLLDRCETHGHSSAGVCTSCVRPLTEAAGLFRGYFLDGFTLRDSAPFDDWQSSETERFRRELTSILERLVACHAEGGELELAASYAQRCLSLDPMHEAMHRRLMLVHSWAGRRPAALRQYRECVRILDRELGVPPLEETTELYQAIREDRAPKAPTSTHRLEMGAPSVERQPADPARRGPAYPLVGRATERDALLHAYSKVGPDGHIVVMEGEAGVGKTRLAEDFLDRVRTTGAQTVTGRCFEGEDHLAYGLVVDLLRSGISASEGSEKAIRDLPDFQISEVGRLVPEITSGRSGLPARPMDTTGAQSRFLEAVAGALELICRADQPGVVFLDDLHWADDASIGLLAYLVRRLKGRPLCILATWRSERVDPGDRLRSILAEAQRAGVATAVPLSRLSPAAVGELVSVVDSRGLKISAKHQERLYSETEGLPFFLVEYLNAISKAERLEEDRWSVPTGVRELVRSRLSAVGETGRQTLETAAVIGRAFDLDTVQRASGRSDEETVAAVEELLTSGLVDEASGGDRHTGVWYDFSHDQVRSLVYDETSLARRRLLHRRVAEAKESRFSGTADRGPEAGAIARHYEMAGRDSEASQYYRLAGDYSTGLFASAEALEHYRKALLLGHDDTAAVNESIGDQLTLLGQYGEAVESYETAASLAGEDRIPGLEGKLGAVYIRRGDWEMAESHVQAAAAGVRESGGEGQISRLLADWSLVAHRRGRTEDAFRLAREAEETADSDGDKRALAQAHNIRGILHRGRGELGEACRHLETSLALADELEDRDARVAALNNLALARGASGELDAAIGLAETAVELCATLGDRHREAAVHNNLADLLHRAGRPDDAMIRLKRAVEIFAEIGEDRGEMQPEIWKLVEW